MIAWHCNAKTYQNFIKLKETRPSREVAVAYYRTDIARKCWILTGDRIADCLYIFLRQKSKDATFDQSASTVSRNIASFYLPSLRFEIGVQDRYATEK